jgi:serine/threonine protein kinase
MNPPCLDDERLLALAEGEQAAEDETAHLARCPHCTRRLTAFSTDQGLLAELGDARLGAGLVFGRYRSCVSIARGGMSEVYRGLDPDLQPVAVKVCRHQSLMPFFRREAELLTRCAELDIPGVLRLREQALDHLPAYLVTDFLPGGTLADRLRAGGRPAAEVVTLMRCLASTLSALAANGLIHGDLKPGNIIFTAEGSPLVIDLGVARSQYEHAAKTDAALTAMRMPPMTVAYAAPEQIRGQAGTLASDIYALGLLLYETATGRHPFQGATLYETSAKILAGTPPPPGLDMNTRWAQLIVRCLDPDPARRPSAETLASWDDAALAQRVRRPPTTRVVKPASVTPWWRRPPALIGASGLMLVLTWLLAHLAGPEVPPPTPASEPVPVQRLFLFADGVPEGWEQRNDGCYGHLRNTETTHENSAISWAITLSGTNGYASLVRKEGGQLDTRPYQALSFWIHGGDAGGQALEVQAVRTGGPQAGRRLAPLPAGRWLSVTIPLDALGAARVPDLVGIRFSNVSRGPLPIFYVDDLSLDMNSPPDR